MVLQGTLGAQGSTPHTSAWQTVFGQMIVVAVGSCAAPVTAQLKARLDLREWQKQLSALQTVFRWAVVVAVSSCAVGSSHCYVKAQQLRRLCCWQQHTPAKEVGKQQVEVGCPQLCCCCQCCRWLLRKVFYCSGMEQPTKSISSQSRSSSLIFTEPAAAADGRLQLGSPCYCWCCWWW